MQDESCGTLGRAGARDRCRCRARRAGARDFGENEGHMSNLYDIEFFWDPVCPFAWITSRWVAKVSAQTGYRVDWRFIALRLLNKQKDYTTEFPPEYEYGHTA